MRDEVVELKGVFILGKIRECFRDLLGIKNPRKEFLVIGKDINPILNSESLKKKFKLEFDEAPALVFVSHDGNNKEEVYIHGERPNGWTGIDIHSEVGAFTTYKLSSIAVGKDHGFKEPGLEKECSK